MERRYWHKLDIEEFASLMSTEPTIEFIMDSYLQPDWCELDDALHPTNGCESLTGEDRIDISKRFCSLCRFCRKPKGLGLFGV